MSKFYHHFRMDSRQSRMDETEKERKAKHKEWMRKKDEESRKKLMRVYGPTPVFDTCNFTLFVSSLYHVLV